MSMWKFKYYFSSISALHLLRSSAITGNGWLYVFGFATQILIKMKELKKMIIDNLCSEYPIEEATEQVNNAEIIIKGETVRVIYDNDKSDLFKLVVSERLELVS